MPSVDPQLEDAHTLVARHDYPGRDLAESSQARDATAVSGLAMMVAATVGAIVSAARDNGNVGGYGVICFVGGVTYAVVLLVLRRRS